MDGCSVGICHDSAFDTDYRTHDQIIVVVVAPIIVWVDIFLRMEANVGEVWVFVIHCQFIVGNFFVAAFFTSVVSFNRYTPYAICQVVGSACHASGN